MIYITIKINDKIKLILVFLNAKENLELFLQGSYVDNYSEYIEKKYKLIIFESGKYDFIATMHSLLSNNINQAG